MKTKRTLIAVLSTVTMLASISSAFAETNIAIGTSITNSAINGDVNIANITQAYGNTVNSQITNNIANVVATGDITVDNISSYLGNDVTSVKSNIFNGVAAGGDINVSSIDNIFAKNAATVGYATGFVNTMAADGSITNIVNTNGANNLTAVIQSATESAVFNGNFDIFNMVQ